ncbi:MAG: beta-lactamase family protein [Phycisphaerales bacterium]|nr:MAG: beta-lactamase family protein [Phycisphaerales bacterium]
MTTSICSLRAASPLLLLLAFSQNLAAQDITAQMDEYMAAQQEVNHFMGSVLVARDGKPIYRKGFGLANAEYDVPNAPQTKFRLASNGKMFTSAAILLLQQRGLLNVQDPIGKYLEKPPKKWAKVRIHHLLCHSSGIPNFTSFPSYKETWMVPSKPEETILRFRNKPLEFAPGEKSSYSNSGYTLLAMIIERVSGMPFGDFVEKNIFGPLDMKDTGHDTHAAILKHRATGYTWGENGLEHAPYHDMDLVIGSGSIYSTVDHLLKWEQALYTDRLLSVESREAMFTPYGEVAGRAAGYGWGAGELAGRKVQGHSGRINGFFAQIGRFPEEKVTIIVLSNMWTRSKIARDLASILFGEDYELPKRTGEKVSV